MNLSKQLRFYLDRMDMSATQLAKRSGVSKQVLSLWLSGGAPRNIEQVKKVASVFATTVDHLCFGTGPEKKNQSFDSIPDDEWFSGAFEIKIRRIKK